MQSIVEECKGLRLALDGRAREQNRLLKRLESQAKALRHCQDKLKERSEHVHRLESAFAALQDQQRSSIRDMERREAAMKAQLLAQQATLQRLGTGRWAKDWRQDPDPRLRRVKVIRPGVLADLEAADGAEEVPSDEEGDLELCFQDLEATPSEELEAVFEETLQLGSRKQSPASRAVLVPRDPAQQGPFDPFGAAELAGQEARRTKRAQEAARDAEQRVERIRRLSETLGSPEN